MQPYLFPYTGYFQLLMASDVFVFFDDVNFIRRGYIHRNNILQNGKSVLFSLPLHKPSQNQLINETKIKAELFADWKQKFLKQLQHAYGKTPYYKEVLDLVKKVLNTKTDSISELAIASVMGVCEYLSVDKDFRSSSAIYYERSASAHEKVLSICKRLAATHYINPLGGAELYQERAFIANGITLRFQKPVLKPYSQLSKEFLPALSILDLLFNLSPEEVKKEINRINLTQPHKVI